MGNWLAFLFGYSDFLFGFALPRNIFCGNSLRNNGLVYF